MADELSIHKKLEIAEGFLRNARAEIERLTEENLELKKNCRQAEEKARNESEKLQRAYRVLSQCPRCQSELNLELVWEIFGPSEGAGE